MIKYFLIYLDGKFCNKMHWIKAWVWLFWFENGLGVLVTEYLHGFWAAKKKKDLLELFEVQYRSLLQLDD